MNSEPKEIVVLLHGIGHSKLNMKPLALALEKEGYETFNLTYPSLRNNIESLTVWLDNKLSQEQIWQKYDKVNFATHSMGGLVTGFYLQNFSAQIPQEKLGRVAMLGTPHGGSEVADGLKNFWPYKIIFGPAGQELTTSARSNDKIAPSYDLGIIAGTKNWLYPLGKIYIKKPHDGCVSIDSTKVHGMKDHITLHILHGTMGFNPKVHKQVIYFLKNGVFNHG